MKRSAKRMEIDGDSGDSETEEETKVVTIPYKPALEAAQRMCILIQQNIIGDLVEFIKTDKNWNDIRHHIRGNAVTDAPLMAAIVVNSPEMVRELLSHKMNPNVYFPCNRLSALQKACEFGNLEIIELLLKYGANVNHYTSNKLTPLGVAVQNGHNAVVQRLLQVDGIDVNKGQKNKWGNRRRFVETMMISYPLLLAVRNANVTIVNMLIDAGAHLYYTNTKLQTLLHIACQAGLSDIAMALTIAMAPKLDMIDCYGLLPIQYVNSAKDVTLFECMNRLRGGGPLPSLLPQPIPAPRRIPTLPISVLKITTVDVGASADHLVDYDDSDDDNGHDKNEQYVDIEFIKELLCKEFGSLDASQYVIHQYNRETATVSTIPDGTMFNLSHQPQSSPITH